ncbi:MAG TPA: energy transducer TonB [Gemmatimonadales bacterium]|nr:energy transducer TonB [Gemmatimonadales bacterium]
MATHEKCRTRLVILVGLLVSLASGYGDAQQPVETPARGETFFEAVVDVKPAIVFLPSPEYPVPLRVKGVGGRVLVECIVDTMGIVEPNSVKILQTPDTAFSRATIEALLRARFTPARVKGKAVRALVNVPIDFNVKPK